MSLQFLLDENLRGPLWVAIQRHNLDDEDRIDAVRVGDLSELPIGSKDPEILSWCDRNGRILVSLDKSTLDSHVRARLQSGSHVPGIFLIRPQATMKAVIEFLSVATHASDVEEWRDRIWFVP